jgi:hypothetical protein
MDDEICSKAYLARIYAVRILTTPSQITSPMGDVVQPEFANQENGDKVPWGRGMLLTKGGALLGSNMTSTTAKPGESSSNGGLEAGTKTPARRSELVPFLLFVWFGQSLYRL